MTPQWLRGPFGIALRRCFATAAGPTLVATAAAVALHVATAPSYERTAAAAAPWLALPLALAAATCALRAASLWPLFTLGRPGADQVRRLTAGALGGRVAVVAGALVAQLALALPLTPVLALALGSPTTAARHVDLLPSGSPVLDPTADRLLCPVPSGERWTALELRPVAMLPPTSMRATEVQVLADGRVLGSTRSFAESRELAVLEFDSRDLATLELAHVAGNVPLLFPPGSIVLVGTPNHPTWQNGLVAALLALLPSFVALAIGALLGLYAGWPTVATAIGTALFVPWIGAAGPLGSALLALLRGRWLAADLVFPASGPSLALGFCALGATALLGRLRPGTPLRP